MSTETKPEFSKRRGEQTEADTCLNTRPRRFQSSGADWERESILFTPNEIDQGPGIGEVASSPAMEKRVCMQ